ncbi:hypothetical protein [Phenylobacterium sp.]|uniref:hypothetical protein n=1 Tax=Phenylobacterium sp. TaxID=1871053 RepID=UPI0019CB7F83|nr:hypothetical protein [Phenylobacterium sp.]MBC7168708.1 hypothetical protein [Phenylobacterium sp.]
MWTNRLLAFAAEVQAMPGRGQSRTSHRMTAARLRAFADAARATKDERPADMLDKLAASVDAFAESPTWAPMTEANAAEVATLLRAITKLVPTPAERGAA